MMLVGTVNTLLLNGNPLLRYDGYHILSDLVEIPNLAGEADAVWGRWARHTWFGKTSLPQGDVSSTGGTTAVLLAAYAAASKIYMLVVVAGAVVIATGRQRLRTASVDDSDDDRSRRRDGRAAGDA
ncbi:MAG: hypothetical protein QM775_10645 [Pirellulales bacterium]